MLTMAELCFCSGSFQSLTQEAVVSQVPADAYVRVLGFSFTWRFLQVLPNWAWYVFLVCNMMLYMS